MQQLLLFIHHCLRLIAGDDSVGSLRSTFSLHLSACLGTYRQPEASICVRTNHDISGALVLCVFACAPRPHVAQRAAHLQAALLRNRCATQRHPASPIAWCQLARGRAGCSVLWVWIIVVIVERPGASPQVQRGPHSGGQHSGSCHMPAPCAPATQVQVSTHAQNMPISAALGAQLHCSWLWPVASVTCIAGELRSASLLSAVSYRCSCPD